jgi:hypothetical protein
MIRSIVAALLLLSTRSDATGPWPGAVLMAQLETQAFKGSEPAETRRSVEVFLERQGWRLEAYQDNEAGESVALDFEDVPGTLLDQLEARLEGLPEVRSVREDSERSWTVQLGRPLYVQGLEPLARAVGRPHRLTLGLDPRRNGIWVVLSAPERREPEEAAKSLRARNPGKVAWAEAGYMEPSAPAVADRRDPKTLWEKAAAPGAAMRSAVRKK